MVNVAVTISYKNFILFVPTDHTVTKQLIAYEVRCTSRLQVYMTTFLIEGLQLFEFVWNPLYMWRVGYHYIPVPYFEPVSFGGAVFVLLVQTLKNGVNLSHFHDETVQIII